MQAMLLAGYNPRTRATSVFRFQHLPRTNSMQRPPAPAGPRELHHVLELYSLTPYTKTADIEAFLQPLLFHPGSFQSRASLPPDPHVSFLCAPYVRQLHANP